MKITFVGDLTVDRYPALESVQFGGASFNSAVWAQKAGATHVSVMAAVGTDTYGARFLDVLQKKKIDVSGVRTLSGNTSVIEVFIDPATGEHRWGKWYPGVLRHFHIEKEDSEYLQCSDAVVLTAYGPTKHVVSELSAWGKRNAKRPVIVVNFGDLAQFQKSIRIVTDHITGFDIGFFGLDEEPDRQIIQKLKQLSQLTGTLMVITLGAQGVIAYIGAKSYRVGAGSVRRVLNTTGAGDAFQAGFLVSYLSTGDIPASLEKGSSVAARKTQQYENY